MGAYEDLIKGLGELIDLELEVTGENTCCLVYPDELRVQIELSEANDEELLLVSTIGEVPAGRYRIDLLTAALKANGRPHPRYGEIGYNKEKSLLVSYENLPLNGLSAERLKNRVQIFSENSRSWKEALASNSIPNLEEEESGGGARPFGL